jgi:MFS superfamily sulfate permease-like transporter
MSDRYFRFEFIRQDLSAGFVVFLVALPLCLGISLACDAPLLSGIISGVIAGTVVSLISGSELSVSGPAAGLTATILAGQGIIGSFEGLLIATMISGFVQVLLGALRAGHIASLFPISVIKGMLAGIGIIIILKQLPYALGWNGEFDLEEGNLLSAFWSPHSFLTDSVRSISLGALTVSLTSTLTILLWQHQAGRGNRFFKFCPAALAGVVVGSGINWSFSLWAPSFLLTQAASQLVQLPVISSPVELLSLAPSLSLDWLSSKEVWAVGFTIAIIGSVETLLCLEATDKLDPLRRVSRPNRELVAQGVGNILSGILGGLPLTSVIVRSSANVYAGARTRISAFTHGTLLLLSVLIVPNLLNNIPLAALAAVLILVGYKLCDAHLIKRMYQAQLNQSVPFAVTVASVIFLDLLTGVAIGTGVGLFFVLRTNYHSAFTAVHEDQTYFIRFNKDVTFIQKVALKKTLARIPDRSSVIIDGGTAMFIDHDILELLQDFRSAAVDRHIKVSLRNFSSSRYQTLQSNN